MKEEREKPLAVISLFGDIREMIDNASQAVAVAVNTELSMLYWNIDRRINKEILHENGQNTANRLLRPCQAS